MAKKEEKTIQKDDKVKIRIPKTAVCKGQKVVNLYINGAPTTIEVGVDLFVKPNVKNILDEAGYLG